MKLDYATIISPFPVSLYNIGRIRAPTLREIWEPSVTYERYQMYVSLLLATPQLYIEQSAALQQDSHKADAAQQDSDRPPAPQQGFHDKYLESCNMFDIISQEANLQELYREVFDFFLLEKVLWNDDQKVLLTYGDTTDLPTGVIHRDIYPELCDVILQRCGLSGSAYTHDPSKVKNRRSREIMEKLNAGRASMSRHKPKDQNTELPNMIAAVAVYSHSVNFTNIWDLTVCQLYEQFMREQYNVYFDIQKMSVAAYGNSRKTFKGNEWYAPHWRTEGN